MAIPTVAQIAQKLMREFGETLSNSTVQAQVEEWIQETYDEIGNSANWKYLYSINQFSSEANLRLYTLEFALEQEITIRFTSDDYPLKKVDRKYLVELVSDLELSGKPTDWYVEEYNSTEEEYTIGLYPVPDAVYIMEVFGKLRPQELSSTTQFLFPREFLYLLKEGIKVKFREDRKDYSGADRARRRFEANLEKLKFINDSPIAEIKRAQIMDIPSSNINLVRLPPNHFRN